MERAAVRAVGPKQAICVEGNWLLVVDILHLDFSGVPTESGILAFSEAAWKAVVTLVPTFRTRAVLACACPVGPIAGHIRKSLTVVVSTTH